MLYSSVYGQSLSKNAVLPFFLQKFNLLTFFLGNPVDSNQQDVLSQRSEASADTARKGLLVPLCFTYVNIHESQTPNPQTGREMSVCQFCLFLPLQLLAVHQLFEEVAENKTLDIFNKQTGELANSFGLPWRP